ncbi:DASH complex subunit Dad2-domain-containing protein [Peziza echinospora]|nr:DASH complex subunit Dad2-domain-containing protein [Peziza echinospora]
MSQQPPRYSTRSSSLGGAAGGLLPPSTTQPAQHQSPALLARIAEKKAELEGLLQMRTLSAALAAEMERLESKLSTLADGAEAVACVLANWQNVLRAIAMASTPLANLAAEKQQQQQQDQDDHQQEEEEEDQDQQQDDGKIPLPVTLVRIPTQQYQSMAPR